MKRSKIRKNTVIPDTRPYFSRGNVGAVLATALLSTVDLAISRPLQRMFDSIGGGNMTPSSA